MRIMVVGGGGREHAVIKKLKENKKAEKIYALPGNGGIAFDAECVDIGAKEIEKIREFAVKERIDYAVVTPDDPLVMGAVDELEKAGIKCFGPRKNAAIIEGSKVFAKNLMEKYGIPTAKYRTFDNEKAALEYLSGEKAPIVIKADGLALGKGVIIAETAEEARNAVKSIMRDKIFGESGNKVVIEEYLSGPEVSVLAFTDGKTIVPMVSSMDHKRACDGDTGLNTGGMGTVAPNPYYTEEVAKRCEEEIFIPTIRAMENEGRKFKGCLYFGLMITADGPKVIEYNCRFGDPETQVVLPLLKSDLLDTMIAVTEERLEEAKVEFYDGAACCVVAASEGYPQKYETGFTVKADRAGDCEIYYAGVKKSGNELKTSGGRVLGVTAVAKSTEEAVKKAYKGIEKVEFANKYYRKDIGKKALEAEENR